jgi:anti-sigma factor RsiW
MVMDTPIDTIPADAAALRCRDLVELITDYLEGALPAPTRAQFDAHLRECEHCCAYVADMAVLVEQIGSLRESSPSPIDHDELLTLFHTWRERT